MKLVSYESQRGTCVRIGALTRFENAAEGAFDAVVDLQRAFGAHLVGAGDPFGEDIAAIRIPMDCTRFLLGGALSRDAARLALDHVHGVGDPEARQRFLSQGVIEQLDAVRLRAPIKRPGKIISVGANYSSHVQEGRDAGVVRDLPDYPVAFLKMSSGVVGPGEDIVRSRHTEELDYEIELAMVVGRRCRDVKADGWRDVVAGFTIVNDISMRDLIVSEMTTGVVFQGKNLDTACPLGPCIVTEDEIEDPDALDVVLRVNGETRQSDNTRNMRFSCGQILAYWSSRMTLEPGDIVTTGTPSGVAGFKKRFPQRLLKHGDLVEAEIEGIGILSNLVRDEGRPSPFGSSTIHEVRHGN
jgi:acylpyruvate hydrolase